MPLPLAQAAAPGMVLVGSWDTWAQDGASPQQRSGAMGLGRRFLAEQGWRGSRTRDSLQGLGSSSLKQGRAV